MSTLREDFEAWKRTMADGFDAWDACQWATERAANVVEQVGPKEGALKLVTEGFAAAIRGTGGGA